MFEPPQIGPDFPAELRSAREAAGLSRNELAELAGCSPSSLRNWESGQLLPKRPTALMRVIWHVLGRHTPANEDERHPAQEAGMPWAGFHAFRHTCATRLFAAGRNAVQVQRWLGHHSPAFTLATYVHLLDDDPGGPLPSLARVTVGPPGANTENRVTELAARRSDPGRPTDGTGSRTARERTGRARGRGRTNG